MFFLCPLLFPLPFFCNSFWSFLRAVAFKIFFLMLCFTLLGLFHNCFFYVSLMLTAFKMFFLWLLLFRRCDFLILSCHSFAPSLFIRSFYFSFSLMSTYFNFYSLYFPKNPHFSRVLSMPTFIPFPVVKHYFLSFLSALAF